MSDHYCTLADVNALIPQAPYTQLSKPTDAQVTLIIQSVANLIDARIGTLFVVPVVTGPLSLQILRDLCTWGALGRAQESRATGAVTEGGLVQSVWTKKFETWLGLLVDPNDPFTLPDAPVNADRVPKVASQITDSNAVSDIDIDNDVTDPESFGRPFLDQIF